MQKLKLILVVIVLVTSKTMYASDDSDFKVGKISEEDFASYSKCPIDSSAGAFIISDIGKTYFKYFPDRGFEMEYSRKIRLKVIKNSAFECATFKTRLYNGSDGAEKIASIKGITFNMENGELIKSKLTKESQFKEEVSEKWVEFKITMPNVKEGSVIDLEYSILSPYLWNVRDWQFQFEIPVLFSEYTLTTPEYFTFKNFSNGYIPLSQKNDRRTQKQQITESVRANDNGAGRTMNSYTLEYIENINKISATNVKAFIDEPYTSSSRNFLSSVEFELQSVAWPHQPIKSYTKDWETINRELLDYENFGGKLKWAGFIEDTVSNVIINCKDDLQRAQKIFYYLQNHVKWNQENRLYAYKSIKETFKDGSGNSAEINFLLTVMLRKAGLKADPVILSTRSNGMVLMEFPVLDKFNYVICGVNINQTYYTLDATDKYNSFGLLPYRCLNGKGRIISDVNSSTIDLKPLVSNSSLKVVNSKINNNNELECSYQIVKKGYAASEIRETIAESKSIEDYVKKYQDGKAGLVIGNYSFMDIDTITKPLTIQYNNVVISNKCENIGNLLSINPLLFDKMEENPFKLEDRKYPVDYGYSIDDTYIFNIKVPNGYLIDELPKSINMALPKNAGKFTYSCANNGDNVQVLRKFSINQTFFTYEEYKILKEFYSQMVQKEAEMIVFKKAE